MTPMEKRGTVMLGETAEDEELWDFETPDKPQLVYLIPLLIVCLGCAFIYGEAENFLRASRYELTEFGKAWVDNGVESYAEPMGDQWRVGFGWVPKSLGIEAGYIGENNDRHIKRFLDRGLYTDVRCASYAELKPLAREDFRRRLSQLWRKTYRDLPADCVPRLREERKFIEKCIVEVKPVKKQRWFWSENSER